VAYFLNTAREKFVLFGGEQNAAKVGARGGLV
jgi:hypothetical protein